MTRFAAIPMFGAAVTLAAFGVFRGAMSVGPAEGTRLVLAIAPPVSDDARELAEATVGERAGATGAETRVIPAGDQLVVELGETDPQLVMETAAILTRKTVLELHFVAADAGWPAAARAAADPRVRELGIRVLDGALVAADRQAELANADAEAIGCRGRSDEGKRRCYLRGEQVLSSYLATAPELAAPEGTRIAMGRTGTDAWTTYVIEDASVLAGADVERVRFSDRGVIVDVAPDATKRVGAALASHGRGRVATVLDGRVLAVTEIDHAVSEPALRLRTTGPTEEATDRATLELVRVIEAGAAPALTVVRTTPFTRTVGFLPRAWLFLALALVVAVAALVMWRRRPA